MLGESLKLFWSFLKIGLFGFGGGQAMIPLIQEEVVELNAWLTREEFLDLFALGNTLPGPISTKMAASVGYKVAGVLGATSSLIGLMAPSVIAMVALLAVYLRYRDAPQVEGFLRGVRPVVIALLALVVWEFAPRALGFASGLGSSWPLWLIGIVAFALSVRFNVHPIFLIAAGGAIGVIALRS